LTREKAGVWCLKGERKGVVIATFNFGTVYTLH